VVPKLGQSAGVLSVWCGALIVVVIQAVFVGFLTHKAHAHINGTGRMISLGETGCYSGNGQKKFDSSALVSSCHWTISFAPLFLFSSPVGILSFSWRCGAGFFAGWFALAGVILRVIWTPMTHASEPLNAKIHSVRCKESDRCLRLYLSRGAASPWSLCLEQTWMAVGVGYQPSLELAFGRLAYRN